MLRSSLLAALAAFLCTAAPAQQQIRARRVPGPVRDAGVYHVASGTWTRAGGTSNISPACIYRNDKPSGYFGVGWEGCLGVDEIMLPGPTNPKGGSQDAYVIDGMSFAYCKLRAGTIDWRYRFYGSYVPCDDPCSPAGCICELPQVYTFQGLPGGSACWIVTIDLTGGYEVCLDADGGSCAPGYQGSGLGLDHAGVGHSWLTADGGTAGPLLDGNPQWDAPGTGTCYDPAFHCGASATGLGIQDLFAICDGGIAPCALSPGCYFFGSPLFTSCTGFALSPAPQFNLCLFADCTTTCSSACFGDPGFCDEATNPNNVADITLDSNVIGAGPNNLGMVNGPPNQFGYPLIALGSTIIQNPPGAKGALCLAGGGSIGRYVKDIGNTGAGGTLNVDISSSLTGGPNYGIPNPPGGNIQPGQSWNFQYWHRQPMGAPSSFSSAIHVTFF